MRFKLSTLVLASAALAAVAALTPNTAMAESLMLKVPFSFSVQGKSLPAGDYLVQRDAFRSFIKLQARNSVQSFTWVACPADGKDNRVTLRFEEQGSDHILESVQFGAQSSPRLVKRDKHHEGMAPETVIGQ
jgi:hypothetical protein